MQIVDGAYIEYDEGRALECRAVTNLEDLTPYNFLDHVDQRTAHQRVLVCAKGITDLVMGLREEKVGDAIPLPGVESVYRYISSLGMQPYGKLIYVEQRPDIKVSGITSSRNLRAMVIKQNIVQIDSDPNIPDDMLGSLNDMRIAGVAAHELTHLAGTQDKVFFTVSEDGRRYVDLAMAGSKLEGGAGCKIKGAYFEEVFASLVHGMYFWYLLGDKMQELVAMTTMTRPFQSPKGRILHVPYRINLLGHQEYAFCGWGMERLIQADPDIWDTLIASRQYNTRATFVREKLRYQINSIYPELFELMDLTDIEDLEENMETTDRINHAVQHRKG